MFRANFALRSIALIRVFIAPFFEGTRDFTTYRTVWLVVTSHTTRGTVFNRESCRLVTVPKICAFGGSDAKVGEAERKKSKRIPHSAKSQRFDTLQRCWVSAPHRDQSISRQCNARFNNALFCIVCERGVTRSVLTDFCQYDSACVSYALDWTCTLICSGADKRQGSCTAKVRIS